jgi:repressor LexA
MIDIGIYEDDLLAVHKIDKANPGDIVVARIDGDVTVKRLGKIRHKYRLNLLAENPDYEPIEVDLRSSDFAIEGISVGVIRRNI